jgi:hypothetical protein
MQTIRSIIIDHLTENKWLRIGPMKARTGDHRENRSRLVDLPDIVGNYAGSWEKGKR